MNTQAELRPGMRAMGPSPLPCRRWKDTGAGSLLCISAKYGLPGSEATPLEIVKVFGPYVWARTRGVLPRLVFIDTREVELYVP